MLPLLWSCAPGHRAHKPDKSWPHACARATLLLHCVSTVCTREISYKHMLSQDALSAINDFTDGTVSCVSLSWGEDEASWDDKVLPTGFICSHALCNASSRLISPRVLHHMPSQWRACACMVSHAIAK